MAAKKKKPAPKRESKYDVFRRAVNGSVRNKILDNYARQKAGLSISSFDDKELNNILSVMKKQKIGMEALPSWVKSGMPVTAATKTPVEQMVEALNEFDKATGEGVSAAAGGALSDVTGALPDIPGPQQSAGGGAGGDTSSLDINSIISQLGLDQPDAAAAGPTPEQTQAAVAQFFGGPINNQVANVTDQLRGTANQFNLGPGAQNVANALQNQPQATAQYAAALSALQKMGNNNQDPYARQKLKLEALNTALQAQSLAREGRQQEAKDVIDSYNAQTSRLGAYNDRAAIIAKGATGETAVDRLSKFANAYRAFSSVGQDNTGGL